MTVWRARARLFTLIELLVVTVIVLAAVAVLLPAVLAGLNRARQVVCLGNLKQIGTGLLQYTDDHGGYAIPAEPPEPIEHWLNYLYVDALNRDVRPLRCPGLAYRDLFNPYGGTGAYAELTRASYVMNIVREADVHGWSGLPAAISTPYPRSFGWVTGTATMPVRLYRVSGSEAKVWVLDSAPGLTNTASAIGILRMTESDYGPLDPNANGEVNVGERKVGWQHLQRFNALFGDGHAEGRRQTAHEEWNVHQLP